MSCKNCGNEIKENEKFCSSCGTPVEEKNNLEDTITFGGVEIAKAIIEEENKEAVSENVSVPADEPMLEVKFDEIKEEMEPVEEAASSVEPVMETPVDINPTPIMPNMVEEPAIETPVEEVALNAEPVIETPVDINPTPIMPNMVEEPTIETPVEEPSSTEITPIQAEPIVDDLANTVVLENEPILSEEPTVESEENKVNSVEKNVDIFEAVREEPIPALEEQPVLETPVVEETLSTEPVIDPASQQEAPILNSNDVITNETGIIEPVFPFAETPVDAPEEVNVDPNFDRNVNNIPLNNDDSVVDNSTQQLNVVQEPVVNNEQDMNVNKIEPVSQLETNNIPEEVKEEQPKKKTSKLFIGYLITILVLFIAFMVLFVFTDIGNNLISNFK